MPGLYLTGASRKSRSSTSSAAGPWHTSTEPSSTAWTLTEPSSRDPRRLARICSTRWPRMTSCRLSRKVRPNFRRLIQSASSNATLTGTQLSSDSAGVFSDFSPGEHLKTKWVEKDLRRPEWSSPVLVEQFNAGCLCSEQAVRAFLRHHLHDHRLHLLQTSFHQI